MISVSHVFMVHMIEVRAEYVFGTRRLNWVDGSEGRDINLDEYRIYTKGITNTDSYYELSIISGILCDETEFGRYTDSQWHEG